jgi:hypothetical protein
MKQKFILVFCLSLFFTPVTLSAVTLVAGQGYGSFRLSGAGSTSLASIMTVGLKFNKYIELKYLSLDTSIRMPVMPFRLYDMKYAGSKDALGNDKYTYYDSDVVGLSLSFPFTDTFGISALYGFGRARVYENTQLVGAVDSTATIHKGAVHVFNMELYMDILWGRVLIFTPHLGTMMHFLDKNAGYKNAMSWYLTVSVSYLLSGANSSE